MKLNNKTYDILKWFVIIFMPAFITLVASIGYIFERVWVEPTVAVLTAVNTFLGVIIGVSTHNYNKE